MSRICASTAVLQMNMEKFPQLRTQQPELRSRLENAIRSRRAFVPRDIPVVVHILDPIDPARITDAQVASQIDVLNEDFANRNADLANVPDPFKPFVGNPDLGFHLADQGIVRKHIAVQDFDTDEKMKSSATGGSDPREPSRYLNIWVCPLRDRILGYAQFPDLGPPETDGVVITTTAFGRGGIARPPFDLGRTATHEVGHYLGLFHIWGNSPFPSCSDDDDVADTPVQQGPNVDKPTFPKFSCANQPHGDMFMNFMDYVDDDTMVMFSQGQVARMHAALSTSRPHLGVTLVA